MKRLITHLPIFASEMHKLSARLDLGEKAYFRPNTVCTHENVSLIFPTIGHDGPDSLLPKIINLHIQFDHVMKG